MQGWIYETKRDSPFFWSSRPIATHVGKVIRICESFVIYSHFCTLYINLPKRGEILSKKGVRNKKSLVNLFEK